MLPLVWHPGDDVQGPGGPCSLGPRPCCADATSHPITQCCPHRRVSQAEGDRKPAPESPDLRGGVMGASQVERTLEWYLLSLYCSPYSPPAPASWSLFAKPRLEAHLLQEAFVA